jgi:hypothetical protein
MYAVEVWSGSGGVGANMWDPSTGTGTGASVVYAGASLTPGETYYARVKAFDGQDWGQWSETEFVVTIAAVPTIESCNAAGVVKNSFTTAEDVYVEGSGYGQCMTYDMYVVSDVDWSDGMAIPSPISGTATSVMSDASGEISATTAWSGPLTAGKYDIVIDVNGNGYYDAGIDALDDNDIAATAGFIVVPLQPVIPEVPWGTIIASTTMAIAFLAYCIPKFTRKQKNNTL